MSVSVIILAAGEGTRMRSDRPKPLHMICGRAMVLHVIHATRQLRPVTTALVVGHGADRVTGEASEARPAVGQPDLRRAGPPARHRRRRRRRHDRPAGGRPRRRVDRGRAARRHPAAAARHPRRAGGDARRQRQRRHPAHRGDGRSHRLRPGGARRRRAGAAHRRAARRQSRRAGGPRGVHQHLRLPPRPLRPGAAPAVTPTTPRASTTSPTSSVRSPAWATASAWCRRPPRRPRASTTAGSSPSPSASCGRAPTVTGC